jgi:hypothetical protein
MENLKKNANASHASSRMNQNHPCAWRFCIYVWEFSAYKTVVDIEHIEQNPSEHEEGWF